MVRIYGASDDLIELEGDISEELGAYADKPTYLGFSDGTLLSVTYGADGAYWRINRIQTGTATYLKVEATDETKDYSDVVTLDGEIRWVVFGKDYAK